MTPDSVEKAYQLSFVGQRWHFHSNIGFFATGQAQTGQFD
jgi:hypothetical protein